MKILLQRIRSKFYFRSCNVWTSNPEVAFDFENCQAVSDFIAERRLDDVQMVVKIENPERLEPVPFRG